jgi:hypothetical protein
VRLEPGAVVVVDATGLARGLSAIPDRENALLRLADGRRTVDEITRASGRDRAEVEATLLRLAEAGVLRLAHPAGEGVLPGSTPGPDGAEWFAHPSGDGAPGRGVAASAPHGGTGPAAEVPSGPDPRGGSGRAWGVAAALLLFVALLAVPLRARWSAPPSPAAPLRTASPARQAPAPGGEAPPALLPTAPAPSGAWVAAMAEAGDHLRAGDPARAAAACREAVRLDPANGAGWLALGEASVSAGDGATARAAFERYLALEPEGGRAAEARAALDRLRP